MIVPTTCHDGVAAKAEARWTVTFNDGTTWTSEAVLHLEGGAALFYDSAGDLLDLVPLAACRTIDL